MSRRYRIEEEKAKQLTQDLQEEDDKLKLQKERIFGPLIWRRLTNGIKIQDLKPCHHNEVLDMILAHFIREDVVFRNTKFSEDPESIQSFRDKLLFSIKDNSSIIAVDESNEELAGVLILKAMKKCDYGRVFSRVQLSDGRVYQSIIEFLNYLNRKVDVFNQFQCDVFLRYYLICVRPEYRGNALGFQLMHTGLDIARHLRIPVVMGLFNSYKLQKNARKLGMQTVFEINYVSWQDRAGELVFCDPGAGNYTCALMAGVVPPAPDPEPVGKSTEGVTSKTKVTRAEKRKAVQKAKKNN